jgi:hypothetical protein
MGNGIAKVKQETTAAAATGKEKARAAGSGPIPKVAADSPPAGLNWTPADYLKTAKATAEALCTEIDLMLPGSVAAIRFREEISQLLENIELEIR